MRMRCLALLRCLALAAAVDLASLRSPEVAEHLDLGKLTGRWYEVAVADLAQVGTECQHFENALSGAGNTTVEQAFHTDYGGLPYAMTFVYEPTDKLGVFQKHARGAKALLQLPTVILDFVPGAQEGAPYELLSEYTEKDIVVPVRELRVSSRSPVVAPGVVDALLQRAAARGLPREAIAHVRAVNHSRCKEPAPLVV